MAFEVSRLLIQKGVKVDGLILIDSPSPDTCEPLPKALVDDVIGRYSTSTSTYSLGAVLRFAGQALAAYNRHDSPAEDVSPPLSMILQCRDGVVFEDGYDPSVTWLVNRKNSSTVTDLWKGTLPCFSVIDVGGNHFTAFRDEYVSSCSLATSHKLTYSSSDT